MSLWFSSRPWLGVEVRESSRSFLVDRGRGFETVKWTARRKSRPNVRGYGMTAEKAMYNLLYNVQPLGWHDDPLVGGNMFVRRRGNLRWG